MIASALALAAASVPSPSSPPALAPFVNTGSFQCEMRNRKGDSFTLKGANRDARSDGQQEISIFDIVAPKELGISGEYFAFFKGDSFTLKNWLDHNNRLVRRKVRLTSLSLIGSPREKGGSAFLSTVAQTASGPGETYIGFCDYAFSSAPQNVK
jgi:hypothetical protein